jgi:hypothetical protein
MGDAPDKIRTLQARVRSWHGLSHISSFLSERLIRETLHIIRSHPSSHFLHLQGTQMRAICTLGGVVVVLGRPVSFPRHRQMQALASLALYHLQIAGVSTAILWILEALARPQILRKQRLVCRHRIAFGHMCGPEADTADLLARVSIQMQPLHIRSKISRRSFHAQS